MIIKFRTKFRLQIYASSIKNICLKPERLRCGDYLSSFVLVIVGLIPTEVWNVWTILLTDSGTNDLGDPQALLHTTEMDT